MKQVESGLIVTIDKLKESLYLNYQDTARLGILPKFKHYTSFPFFAVCLGHSKSAS